MTYQGQRAATLPLTLPHGGRVPTWTWQAVEDRMAEAMGHWWRSARQRCALQPGRPYLVDLAAVVDRPRWALIEQLDV
jgi:hypothetical protein